MNEMAETESAPAEPPATSSLTAGGVIKDLGQGVIELPMQTLGGAMDGLVNDTSDLIFDMGHWANDLIDLGQIRWDEKKGVRWTQGTPEGNILNIPSTPPAQSTTGHIIREASNFIALFLGVGKLKAFKAFQAQSKTGQFSKAALQGFVADYVNKPEGNLSGMIQKHPTLENPINAWLSCEKDCGEMDKRLRTALEGVGVGVATEGLIRGLKILKQTRQVKKTIIDKNILPEVALDQKTVEQATKTTLIGNKNDPLIISPDELTKKTSQESGELFVNWAKIDTDDDVKNVIQHMVDADKTSIGEAQRGVRSWKETKLSAEQKDAWSILDTLNQRGTGATLNAEESVALRELWVRSSTKLNEVAQQAAIDSSQNIQFQFQKMLHIHQAVQEKVIAIRTEAARALNSWKIPVGANLEKLIEFDQVINQTGGSEASQALAKKMVTLSHDPSAMNTFVRGSKWAQTKEAAAQLWYFSLLSNPHTHMRNFVSNMTSSLFDVAERKVGSVIGDQISPDEASAKWIGMVSGFKDAFRITARGRQALTKALKETIKGNPSKGADQLAQDSKEFGTVYRSAASGRSGYGAGGKLDIAHEGQVSKLSHRWVGESLNNTSLPEALHKAAGILDTALQPPAKAIDKITMMPSRALQTADELFKTINYQSELHAQATRHAWKLARSGDIAEDQIKDKVAEFVGDPDEFMRIAANEQAQYLTFTNIPPNDSNIWQTLRNTSHIPIVGRIIMPFSRVVYNVSSYTFERTPLAPMVQRWRQDITAGGSRKDLALAKTALGTMTLATAADLSMQGHITGAGSPDWGEQSVDRRMQVQPNSVKIGNRYFSYRGMEPLASPLGIAANLVEILAYSGQDENTQADEIAMAASMAIGNQLVSQQYMMGVASLFDAMSDPTRKGERWFQSVARAMVPAGLGQYTRTITDPDLHQVENVIDAMKSKIPGLSADVPYTIDLWGRRINLRSGLGEVYDFLSPVYSKQFDPEPIDLELKRLGYFPSGMPRKLNFDGVTVDMENYPHAWERLKVLAGNALTTNEFGVPVDLVTKSGLKDTLNRVVRNKHPLHTLYPLMTDGPNGGKSLLIRKIINQFRDAAKQQIAKEFPEIDAEIKIRRLERRVYKFEGNTQ
ncbi:MAG: hypothetical protein KZQ62_09275 [Candidatus Thiodiazotropha sp. (ex Lucinoma aequizonata)]|nr:hypothetical protein [Candidatus Thiodiazotropha sp. (ex Lucinoma aequizonata)]